MFSQMMNLAPKSVNILNKEASKCEQKNRNHFEHEANKVKFPVGNIAKKSDEEEAEFSKEVVKAIAEIDSRISDLQLMTMNPVKYCNEPPSRQASQPTVLGRNDEYLSKNVLKNNQTLSKLGSQPNGNQTSQGTSYVQGLRLPDLSQDEHDSGTSPPFGVIQNHPTARKASSTTTRKTITRRVSLIMPPPDHDHHKIIVRPTLLMNQQNNQRRKSDPSERETESETRPNSISSPTRSSSSATEDDDGSETNLQSSSSYSTLPIRTNTRKTYFSRQERDSEKGIGGLKRIKNKLGLIFHHHHHHHHHHHDHDDRNRGNWKLLQRTFHPKTKALKNNYKHNGTRKSVVKSSNNNTKRGRDTEHFHALVEGLMQHVGGRGRLKKPKAGKGGRNNRRLGKGIGWWQKFGGLGGMKMVNRRGRVRMVRFANKTPKLKL